MKIALWSDLHLETHPHWQPPAGVGADVLVLAGDIGSYQQGSLLTDPDFGLGRFAPAHGWPTPVLYIPGNHEYDGLDFDTTHDRLRACCQRLGITWLEREGVVLDGVRFVGTTLWTDFDALAPRSEAPPERRVRGGESLLTRQLRARDKAFRAANYYLRTTQTQFRGRPMLAEQVRSLAFECQQWLYAALQQPFAGPTVVVTHFAPSLRSADPRYGLVPGTAGFCNALDDWLGLAQLWLHGHLHAPSDYIHHGCRVVANPLGYVRKNEQQGFRPGLLISV